MSVRVHAGVLLPILAAACAISAPTPSPGPTTTASPSAAPAPTPELLAWPTDSAIALTPGRYLSAPPFDIRFTIDIPDGPWGSAHLHGEFFDFVDVTELGVEPTRWVAFAHPETIGGSDAVAAQGLSPRDAAEALTAVEHVTAGPVAEGELFGLAGVRVDVATDVANTALFGGPAGQFGLAPTLPARIMILPHDADGDLLLVLVLAPHGELDAAWTEVAPILATIVLES
jgi:hypothetical protein